MFEKYKAPALFLVKNVVSVRHPVLFFLLFSNGLGKDDRVIVLNDMESRVFKVALLLNSILMCNLIPFFFII